MRPQLVASKHFENIVVVKLSNLRKKLDKESCLYPVLLCRTRLVAASTMLPASAHSKRF